MRVARLLRSSNHDVAVVTGPDYHLALDISPVDVRRAAMEQRTVYTTGVNDADGYTNGFYIGHPRPLSQVMGPVRVAHSQLMKLDIGSGVYDGATYPNNYEVLLRSCCGEPLSSMVSFIGRRD